MKLIPESVLLRKEEFLSKVKILENGCWEWQGCMHPRGYGNFSKYKAHRVSYAMFNGSFPNELYICHKCDFTKCVRPDHLFAGTQKDNMEDMIKKGRGCGVGLDSPMCIMTEEKLSLIVDFYNKNKSSIQKTANKFGLKYTHCRVWLIRGGCDVGKIKIAQQNTMNKAIEDYLSCNDSANVVSKRHGITGGPLTNALKKRGIPIRNSEKYHPKLNKLNENEVREIRKLRSEGKSNKEVGVIFGRHETAICALYTGKRWGHIKTPYDPPNFKGKD